MRKLFLAVSAFILSLVLLNIPSSGFAQEIFLAPSGYPDVVEQTEPAQLKSLRNIIRYRTDGPRILAVKITIIPWSCGGKGERQWLLKLRYQNLNPADR